MSSSGLMPLLTAFLAMKEDLHNSRIPNRLLAVCFLGGICERVIRLNLQENMPPAMDLMPNVLTVAEVTENVPSALETAIFMAAGMLLPAVLLALPYLAGGLGAGDVKLFCVLGSMLGPDKILFCMFCSFLSGGLWAVILLIKGKGSRKRFPFAPAVFAGTCICMCSASLSESIKLFCRGG